MYVSQNISERSSEIPKEIVETIIAHIQPDFRSIRSFACVNKFMAKYAKDFINKYVWSIIVPKILESRIINFSNRSQSLPYDFFVSKRQNSFESIVVNNINHTDASYYKALMHFVAKSPRLLSLKLTGRFLPNLIDVSFFKNISQNCLYLKSLFVKTDDNPLHGKRLFDSLHRLKNLESLHIESNQLLYSQIDAIIKNCTKLKKLSLVDCEHISDVINPLITSNLNLTKLTLIDLVRPYYYVSFKRLFQKMNNITSLSLSEMNSSILTQLPQLLPKLKKLTLKHSAITAHILLNIFKNCKSLEYLKLERCPSIIEGSFNLGYQIKALNALSLVSNSWIGNSSIQHIVRFFPNLEFLEITDCRYITPLSLQYISPHCKKLKSLIFNFKNGDNPNISSSLKRRNFLREFTRNLTSIRSISFQESRIHWEFNDSKYIKEVSGIHSVFAFIFQSILFVLASKYISFYQFLSFVPLSSLSIFFCCYLFSTDFDFPERLMYENIESTTNFKVKKHKNMLVKQRYIFFIVSILTVLLAIWF